MGRIKELVPFSFIKTVWTFEKICSQKCTTHQCLGKVNLCRGLYPACTSVRSFPWYLQACRLSAPAVSGGRVQNMFVMQHNVVKHLL